MPEPSADDVVAALDGLSLIDHHVHGALTTELGRATFEHTITESDRPLPAWMTQFDSQLGFAIRRWCAPLLDLPPHSAPEEYLQRRAELGVFEVNRRFLRGAGLSHLLVDTGLHHDLLPLEDMASLSGAQAHEVVRLESVLEKCARQGLSPDDLPEQFPAALAERTREAIGLKSIIAYRYGLDFDPERPNEHEVVAAARTWLRQGGPLRDPVLLRFVLWAGVDRGLPLQLHTGLGDPDLRLHRCDPLLLTEFIELVAPTGTNLVLLHCYPFHRHAGFLAQLYPHVFFDVGLAINHTGVRSSAVVAEALETAPFGKLLYSSDAFGPAELHYLGALLWRRALRESLLPWVREDAWPSAEAIRVAHMIGRDNAAHLYGLLT